MAAADYQSPDDYQVENLLNAETFTGEQVYQARIMYAAIIHHTRHDVNANQNLADATATNRITLHTIWNFCRYVTMFKKCCMIVFKNWDIKVRTTDEQPCQLKKKIKKNYKKKPSFGIQYDCRGQIIM